MMHLPFPGLPDQIKRKRLPCILPTSGVFGKQFLCCVGVGVDAVLQPVHAGHIKSSNAMFTNDLRNCGYTRGRNGKPASAMRCRAV